MRKTKYSNGLIVALVGLYLFVVFAGCVLLAYLASR